MLATAELWKSGYQMRGFFSFEEHFNADRLRYYESLQMGLPIDFYDGRYDPDYTTWLEYFVKTLAQAADNLKTQAEIMYQARDIPSVPWDNLSRRQQQILTRLLARILSKMSNPLVIRPADIESWFGISDRTAREWLGEWVETCFMEPIYSGEGKRIREYKLADTWSKLLHSAEEVDVNSGRLNP
ncbi:MAG: hypothetical protein B0A82_03265 [Alkalinema sp. CACIAM 70d]|nr:MAG: hypothetical protein B0A82_03265 [Alkalinema sp. CACIAM 70d]